ncbi:MAG: ATP-binding protein [Vulcanimicrobiaceae bacterium]
MSLRLPAKPQYAAEGRRQAVAFARSVRDCDDDVVADVESAVGEGLANAIEHGSKGDGLIELRFKYEPEALIVEIEDHGLGFEGLPRNPPHPYTDRGRGIGLISSLTDEMTYERGGRLLRFRKVLR